eukprot:gene16147-22305_t
MKDDSTLKTFAAAGIAGATSWSILYPLEVVRSRVTSGLVTSSNIPRVLSSIARTEGISTLYKGLGWSVAGIIPEAAITYGLHDVLKRSYKKLRGQESPVPVSLAFGIASAFAGQTVSFPLETISRRMQVGQSIPTILKEVSNHGGIKYLYRGIGAATLRLIPMAMVSFGVYEFMRAQLLQFEELREKQRADEDYSKLGVAAKITDFVKLDYLMDPRYPAYWAMEVAISMIFGLRKDNEYCMGAVGWWLETMWDDKLGTMCRTHIIMPAIDRTLLTHVVSSKNPIGSIEFLGLLEEASRAVRFLHKSGMVHSDVKAENFLIRKKQAHSVEECAYQVKISDFGLTTPNVKYSTNRSDDSQQAKGDLTLQMCTDVTKEEASHPVLHEMGAEAEAFAIALGIQQLCKTPAPLHECQDKATAGCVPVASAMKAPCMPGGQECSHEACNTLAHGFACKAMRKGVARFVRALLPTRANNGGTPGYMGKKDEELASYMRDMYAFGKMIRYLLFFGHLCLSNELYDRLQALADCLVVEDRDMRPDAAKLVKSVKEIAAEERKMEEDRPSLLWVSCEADSPPSSAHSHPVSLPPVHCHTSPSSLAVVEKSVPGYIAALPYCRAAMILRANACISDDCEAAKGDLTLHVGADCTKEEASNPVPHEMGAEQNCSNTPAQHHDCQEKATAGCVPVASAMKAARSACKAMRKGVARFARALLPTRAK